MEYTPWSKSTASGELGIFKEVHSINHCLRRWVLWAALGAPLLVACPADTPVADGGADLPVITKQDGISSGEGSSVVVDFVVQGCAERTATQCKGPVPLNLTFSAVLSIQPTSVTWSLGDSSPDATGKVVTHSYTKPGSYDVAVTVADSGGTTSELKTAFVVVQKGGPGSACLGDGDCTSGSCVCLAADGCPAPLDQGLCLQKCEQQCPQSPTKAACIDLSYKSSSPVPAWRTRLCLPQCSSDLECTRPGFSCRLAPSTLGWLNACLPPFPRAVAAPCRSAAGAVDPASCLGGLCLDIGASGYCSSPCQLGTCPPQTSCALFNGSSQSVCLAQCQAGACASDPLLACQSPGASGALGFSVPGSPDPAGTMYCAAKPCKTDSDCGLTGSCDATQGSFCVAGP